MTFVLPTITTAKDTRTALSALFAAVLTGDITPSDAAEAGKLVDGYVKAFEINESADRLERLEDDDNMRTNLVSRVVKLGSRHRTDDQVLLLWIAPAKVLKRPSGRPIVPGYLDLETS